jgi:hypothetical protein
MRQALYSGNYHFVYLSVGFAMPREILKVIQEHEGVVSLQHE